MSVGGRMKTHRGAPGSLTPGKELAGFMTLARVVNISMSFL